MTFRSEVGDDAAQRHDHARDDDVPVRRGVIETDDPADGPERCVAGGAYRRQRSMLCLCLFLRARGRIEARPAHATSALC